jgi:hypothetical protein
MYTFTEEERNLNTHFYTLINKYFLETATQEEVNELEEVIKNDPEACREYIDYSSMDANLRSIALEPSEIPKSKKSPKSKPKKARRFPVLLFTATVAAVIALAFYFKTPESVGVIHTSDANWGSTQPTVIGVELFPGTFEIKSGSSTLKLHSGADITLNGPVKFQIVSDMQIKVQRGSLSVYVRESAKGFRVNTPHGYAVDKGTRFSVNFIDNSCRFEVQDGKISLHHNSGKENTLSAGQSSVMTERSMNLILQTLGDEATVVENPQRIPSYAIDKKFLMVKKSGLGYKNSRRSFFAFKLSDNSSAKSARLILNYIPTDMGDRKTMPIESEFELFGIPDGPNEKWERNGMSWQKSPKLENLQFLATFKVSRETRTKKIIIETDKFTQFIKDDNNRELGFVITCKTPGGKMVHGFASSKHGEEEGPILEIFAE